MLAAISRVDQGESGMNHSAHRCLRYLCQYYETEELAESGTKSEPRFARNSVNELLENSLGFSSSASLKGFSVTNL